MPRTPSLNGHLNASNNAEGRVGSGHVPNPYSLGVRLEALFDDKVEIPLVPISRPRSGQQLADLRCAKADVAVEHP
jgi:hypothetical protein